MALLDDDFGDFSSAVPVCSVLPEASKAGEDLAQQDSRLTFSLLNGNTSVDNGLLIDDGITEGAINLPNFNVLHQWSDIDFNFEYPSSMHTTAAIGTTGNNVNSQTGRTDLRNSDEPIKTQPNDRVGTPTISLNQRTEYSLIAEPVKPSGLTPTDMKENQFLEDDFGDFEANPIDVCLIDDANRREFSPVTKGLANNVGVDQPTICDAEFSSFPIDNKTWECQQVLHGDTVHVDANSTLTSLTIADEFGDLQCHTATGVPSLSTSAGVPSLSTSAGVPSLSTSAGVPSLSTSAGVPSLSTSAGVPSLSTSAGVPSLSTSAGVPSLSTSAGVPSLSTSAGVPSLSTSAGVPSLPTFAGVPSLSTSAGVPSLSTSAGLPSLSTSAGVPSLSTSAGVPSLSTSAGVPSLSSSAGVPSLSTSAGVPSLSTSAGVPSLSTSAGVPSLSTSAGVPSLSTSAGVPSLSAQICNKVRVPASSPASSPTSTDVLSTAFSLPVATVSCKAISKLEYLLGHTTPPSSCSWQSLQKSVDLTVPLYKWDKSYIQEVYLSSLNMSTVMSGTSENLLDAFGFETFPMQSQPTSLPLHSTEVSEVALLDLGSPTVKSNGGAKLGSVDSSAKVSHHSTPDHAASSQLPLWMDPQLGGEATARRLSIPIPASTVPQLRLSPSAQAILNNLPDLSFMLMAELLTL